MPDMYRSPAIEAYIDYGEVRTWIPNDSLKNRLTALQPPVGTVPFQGSNSGNVYLPYDRMPTKGMDKTHGISSVAYSDSDYVLSALDKNPLAFNQENVDKGEVLYNRFCDHCHGEKGAGDGKVSVSSNGLIVPPANAFEKEDGQMFYSITYGKGVMGSHASQLNKRERWEVISYLKTLAGKEIPSVQEVVEEVSLKDQLLDQVAHLADEGDHKLELRDLVFKTGSASLDKGKSKETLETLVEFMKTQSVSIEVDGYTDNTGDSEANHELSQKRADAVKKYLEKNGIDADRITAKGYGEENPVASNDTEEGRARNRRTEVIIK